VAGSGPHHSAGVVPPPGVRIEDADLVERLELDLLLSSFLVGAVDGAEELAGCRGCVDGAADDGAAGDGAAGGTAGRSGSRSSRPWKATAGAGRPSAMGALRKAKRAASNSSLVRHFSMRYLILLTPASARPLLCGLRTEDSSWMIFLEVQNSLNCSLNCGPPSEPIDLGPTELVEPGGKDLGDARRGCGPDNLDQGIRGETDQP
jgi:hypothetical protein